jgi:hypothetical protein
MSSWPRKRIEPTTRGGASPTIAAQSVVFPMPLRPMTATGSPAIANVTPCNTCAEP